MNSSVQIRKIALSGLLIAVAVVGSLLSFPILGSKCAPVQHLVNIVCAVFLGPWYGLFVAFCASLLRNLMGLGSLLAFPGSMFGALLCGLFYAKFPRLIPTCIAEVAGTSILGGLAAYPIALLFLGQSAAEVAFYAYMLPFFISTAVGALIAGTILLTLEHTGVLARLKFHEHSEKH